MKKTWIVVRSEPERAFHAPVGYSGWAMFEPFNQWCTKAAAQDDATQCAALDTLYKYAVFELVGVAEAPNPSYWTEAE